nr:sodium-dependent neutral amino acid transporter B(0)AT3 isoform X3 [Cavia porcellus]
MAQALGLGLLVDEGEDKRPHWDNRLQYLLSCVGFAVGLGNIWRFPYLCQTYGGGAFLIPYLIALVFEGIPLFHIELAIGQRLRRGSIGVWTAISPYLGGVGLGCFTVSFLVSLYYNTVLVWVLWYFLNSFQQPLPWGTCPPNLNRTGLVEECQGSGTVSYFWYRRTLNITADIGDSGAVQWRLLLCQAASWALVYLCVSRGIETTGKAIYFTALFPYLVLTIFLVRGLTLPGATEGLIYLFTPNVQILLNPRVWLDAATQIFFSLSLAFGGHIAFASYNPPRNNCRRDAVIIALVNSATSLYASITIFAIMGFKAINDHGQCLDRNILSLINEFSLPELSISRDDFPAALLHLNTTHPGRVARLPLRACRLEDFLDQVPTGRLCSRDGGRILTPECSRRGQWGEGTGRPCLCTPAAPLSPGLACLVCFLSATCFTLQSGSYWLEVFDNFAASLNLVTFALLEVVGVTYVYGMERFCADVEWMTGRRPSLYWRVSWRVVSPLLLLGILLSYIVLLALKSPSYKAWNPQYALFPSQEEKLYPHWVQATCALLSFLPLLWVPGYALAQWLARHRRQDTQQDTGLKLQDGSGC